MENVHLPAAYTSVTYAFVFFCTLYWSSGGVTYVLDYLKCLATILILTNDILCNNTSASNLDGLVTVHILLGLLPVELSIHCKYWPPFRKMTGHCTLRKIWRRTAAFAGRYIRVLRRIITPSELFAPAQSRFVSGLERNFSQTSTSPRTRGGWLPFLHHLVYALCD